MSSLIPFSFESHEIRVLTINDELWFVAKDIAEALEYTRFDSNLLLSVPDEWKDTNPIRTPSGIQEMWCISEQGLYFFINRSDKPKALPFQKWIAGDVLTSIRKTGSYSLPGTSSANLPSLVEQAFSSCLNIAKLCGFTDNMALLSADTGTKTLTGLSALSLIGATHLLADERGKVYTPTELGKLMEPHLSAIKFNLALEASGLQKKEMGGWLPTDDAEGFFEWADTGKKHSNGTQVKQLRWFKTVLDQVLTSQQREAA